MAMVVKVDRNDCIVIAMHSCSLLNRDCFCVRPFVCRVARHMTQKQVSHRTVNRLA